MKLAKIIFLFVIFFFTTSLTFHDFAYDLLSQEDMDLFSEDSKGPAMSSGLHLPMEEQWQTYNMWLCFKASEIEILDSEVDYDGWKKLPYILVNHMNHEYEFHLSPEVGFVYEDVMSSWNELLYQAQRVCIYAAHFPQKDLNGDDFSSWYMVKIKTDNGYWEEYPELQEGIDSE